MPYKQGPDLIEKARGLHGFMNWKRNLLTVSAILLTLQIVCYVSACTVFFLYACSILYISIYKIVG